VWLPVRGAPARAPRCPRPVRASSSIRARGRPQAPSPAWDERGAQGVPSVLGARLDLSPPNRSFRRHLPLLSPRFSRRRRGLPGSETKCAVPVTGGKSGASRTRKVQSKVVGEEGPGEVVHPPSRRSRGGGGRRGPDLMEVVPAWVGLGTDGWGWWPSS
jgi:hypothetical protein